MQSSFEAIECLCQIVIPDFVREFAASYGIENGLALLNYKEPTTDRIILASRAINLMEKISPAYMAKISLYVRGHAIGHLDDLDNATQKVEFCARLALLYSPHFIERKKFFTLASHHLILEKVPLRLVQCPSHVYITLAKLCVDENRLQEALSFLSLGYASDEEYQSLAVYLYQKGLFNEGFAFSRCRMLRASPQPLSEKETTFHALLEKGIKDPLLVEDAAYQKAVMRSAKNDLDKATLIKACFYYGHKMFALALLKEFTLESKRIRLLIECLEFVRRREGPGYGNQFFEELMNQLAALDVNRINTALWDAQYTSILSVDEVLFLCALANDPKSILSFLHSQCNSITAGVKTKLVDIVGLHQLLATMREQLKNCDPKKLFAEGHENWLSVMSFYCKYQHFNEALETANEYRIWWEEIIKNNRRYSSKFRLLTLASVAILTLFMDREKGIKVLEEAFEEDLDLRLETKRTNFHLYDSLLPNYKNVYFYNPFPPVASKISEIPQDQFNFDTVLACFDSHK